MNVVFYGDFYKHMFANTGIFSLLNFKEKNTCFQFMGKSFGLGKSIYFAISTISTTAFVLNVIITTPRGTSSNGKLILDDSKVDLFKFFFLECFFSHVVSILSMVVPLSFFRPLLKCHLFKRVVLPNNLT